MKFLGIGEECDLGDMYYRLGKAGHEVRVYVENESAHDIFGGMIHRTEDWRRELAWIKAAGSQGIVLFESALKGEIQDDLRRDGYRVIGGSSYGDRLEADREFGQQALRELGLRTAATHRFSDFDSAINHVRAFPGRYVLKNNGADTARTLNYVGEMDDGADVIALLSVRRRQTDGAAAPDFVLMDYVSGVEVGVGAYFNGERFLLPACLDWEHKHFFPDDLGELTGEMGTIVTYRDADRLFGATLALMADKLGAGGYCGYINLNLIVNEAGLWPLEFTSRFGYPGYAICGALQLDSWEEILVRMLERREMHISTRPGYAAGIVLTLPPFPYQHGYAELSKGTPLCFRSSMTDHQRAHLHFCEVQEVHGQLVASGTTGCVAVATGTGATIEEARAEAEQLASQVVAPNLRYRKDIGRRLIQRDLLSLRDWGYIDSHVRT